MAKVRLGFVSNSSSSSFIAEFNSKGQMVGSVSGVCGIGFVARITQNLDRRERELLASDVFFVEDDCNSSSVAFVRSFSQMRLDQTLDDFKNETLQLWTATFSELPFDNVRGPVLLAAGEVDD